MSLKIKIVPDIVPPSQSPIFVSREVHEIGGLNDPVFGRAIWPAFFLAWCTVGSLFTVRFRCEGNHPRIGSVSRRVEVIVSDYASQFAVGAQVFECSVFSPICSVGHDFNVEVLSRVQTATLCQIIRKSQRGFKVTT